VAYRIGDLESKALALFVFALPGSAYIFAGQELGLPDGELHNSDRQDPSFIRSKGAIKGRDGARVPLPWSGENPPFGFTTGKPWLPLNQSWSALTIEKESTNPDSVLNLYRKALSLRAQFLAGSGEIQWLESPLHGTKSSELLGFKRGAISVFMNLSHNDLVFDFSGQVLLSSTNGSLNLNDNSVIPACSTVWILN
jgi:alpha-glucosidase